MARTAYFDGAATRWFAHRGLSQHDQQIDENSHEAFRAAIAHGATHIESDVHCTADGVAVLFHDNDLSRVAGVSRRISQVDYSELSALRLKNGSSVPRLDETLESFPGVRFNLDIKSFRAVGPTVEAIEGLKTHDRVLVSSFSEPRRLAALQQLTRPVATSAGGSRVLKLWAAHKAGLRALIPSLVYDIDALQLPVQYPTNYGFAKFADEAFISRMREYGLEVHFWTVNDPAQMSELIGLGAAGIVTDRVDLAPR